METQRSEVPFPALLYQIGPLVRFSTRRNLEILQEQNSSLTRAGTASSPPQLPRHHWDALASQEAKSVHNPGPTKEPPSSASWGASKRRDVQANSVMPGDSKVETDTDNQSQ